VKVDFDSEGLAHPAVGNKQLGLLKLRKRLTAGSGRCTTLRPNCPGDLAASSAGLEF
jgi:hypothetical protein